MQHFCELITTKSSTGIRIVLYKEQTEILSSNTAVRDVFNTSFVQSWTLNIFLSDAGNFVCLMHAFTDPLTSKRIHLDVHGNRNRLTVMKEVIFLYFLSF